ncbi:hypothetical protein OPV22_029930 [Ensete ventricosum]|uniref:SREBP regulating gene protein n=1 Tax=Ensete ventricosum TaxID=4639 RepID=A0AAV8Q2P2_ENSVE|nr:hypothetical protein OPV22_029930 [Ensete ventricosum]
MSGDISGRPKPLLILLLLVAISLRSVSGLSDDHPSSKDAVNANANPSNSSSNTRHETERHVLQLFTLSLLRYGEYPQQLFCFDECCGTMVENSFLVSGDVFCCVHNTYSIIGSLKQSRFFLLAGNQEPVRALCIVTLISYLLQSDDKITWTVPQ